MARHSSHRDQPDRYSDGNTATRSQVFSIYVSDVNGNAPIPGTTVNKASKGTLSTTSVTIPDTRVRAHRINVSDFPWCAERSCAAETVTLDVIFPIPEPVTEQ
jgi:hypothetical protein